ncbi:MAG: hypothetical protein RL011_1558 [Pseudomonadota bacterium]|jgi:type II secretion system protein C
MRWAGRASLVVAGSYLAASFVSAYLMSQMLESAVSVYNTMSRRKITTASINLTTSVNYRDIEHAIHERNLFNSGGQYPDEKAGGGGSGGGGGGDSKPVNTFDINAACKKPTLNVELVGTIYLGSKDSIATVQEQGYSESDSYREGDLVYGSDAVVVKIERNRVIINNKGTKECLELASEVKLRETTGGFPDTKNSTQPPQGQVVNDCLLDEKYVHDELGPGFGTIIQKARLVPNTVDNQMNGFKIFAIDRSSLYGKTGLQDGDVITQVNDTSLKLPEQGFALLQAFQDDKEVRIHILRSGTTPMTLTCRIK